MTPLPFKLTHDALEGAPGTGWYVVYGKRRAPATPTEIALWQELERVRQEIDKAADAIDAALEPDCKPKR